jgi:hypothetical protein
MDKISRQAKMAAAKLAEQEKRQEENRKMHIKDITEEVASMCKFLHGKEPRRFEVGEQVVLGNLDNPVVKSVVSGEVYEIEYTDKVEDRLGRHTGEYARSVNFFPWYTIFRPVPDDSKYRLDHIPLSFCTFDIEGLIGHCRAGMNVDPDYQRGLVWSDEDRNRLITTIMSGGDIGKFVFARNDYGTEGDLYEVIDGKQRLDTILSFYLGAFAWRAPSGDEVTYGQMSRMDRNHFRSFHVSCATIENNPSRETRMKVFLQVNNTGRRVDQDHIDRIRTMLAE